MQESTPGFSDWNVLSELLPAIVGGKMKRQPVLFALVCCLAIHAAAQADRATLSGTVTDPSGAFAAGARVEVTDAATGFRRVAVTGGAGSYSIGSLPAGTYKAAFSRPSFQTLQYDSLSLLVGE